MLLTKETDNIMKIAEEYDGDYKFPEIDSSKESYYVDYKNSIHQEETVMGYSSELVQFKKKLLELWADSENQCFNKDIISGMLQTKDDDESVLEAIQLFNYMM